MNRRDRRLKSRFFKNINAARKRTPGNLTDKPKSIKHTKKKSWPKVSIITYVYCTKNNSRWNQLQQNIKSISCQKYPNYEHIIVDDGSPIPLGKMIKKLNDPHIKYYKKDHTGITENTKTFNYGLKVATGKYLMILSSDDVHLPGTIKLFVNFLENNVKPVAVVGNVLHQRLSKSGVLISQKRMIRRESVPIRNALMKSNVVNACATMFRKSALDKISLPPDPTGFAADYDLWVRLSEIGAIVRVQNIVIKYRNFGNATRILTKKDKKYRYRCISYVKNTAKKRRGIK